MSEESVVVNGCEYVTKADGCKSCEFAPPCRLCTWVDGEVMSDVYRDVETFMVVNKKDHLVIRKKMVRARGVRENKGRGRKNGSKNVSRRVQSDPMEI